MDNNYDSSALSSATKRYDPNEGQLVHQGEVELDKKNTKGANLGFLQQLIRIHICILRLLAQFDSISKQLSHVIWINDRLILCQYRLGYGWFG